MFLRYVTSPDLNTLECNWRQCQKAAIECCFLITCLTFLSLTSNKSKYLCWLLPSLIISFCGPQPKLFVLATSQPSLLPAPPSSEATAITPLPSTKLLFPAATTRTRQLPHHQRVGPLWTRPTATRRAQKKATITTCRTAFNTTRGYSFKQVMWIIEILHLEFWWYDLILKAGILDNISNSRRHKYVELFWCFFFFAACRLPTEMQSQADKCAAEFLDSENGEPWPDEAPQRAVTWSGQLGDNGFSSRYPHSFFIWPLCVYTF